MARHNKQPPILGKVLKTIKHLKSSRGATASKIISHLKRSNVSPVTRSTTFRIRRELRTGIRNDDLKQQAGKYKLERKKPLPSRRRFSIFDDVNVRKARSKSTKTAVRGKGQKRKLSRSSSSSVTEDTSERSSSKTSNYESADDASASSRSRTADRKRDSELKEKKSKTFKRYKKRQPSRNKSQKRHSETPDRDKVSPQLEPEMNSEPNQVEIDKKPSMISNRSKIKHSCHNEDGLHDSEKPAYHCGNEDCLCNYKKEAEDVKCDSSQSEGPADDYIC